MKQTLKNLVMAVAFVAGTFALTGAVVYAADAEVTANLKKDFEYRIQYAPETITPDYIEWYNLQMPDEEKIEFGRCEYESDEYLRGQAILSIAIMLYSENNDSIKFEDCLAEAESMFEAGYRPDYD